MARLERAGKPKLHKLVPAYIIICLSFWLMAYAAPTLSVPELLAVEKKTNNTALKPHYLVKKLLFQKLTDLIGTSILQMSCHSLHLTSSG